MTLQTICQLLTKAATEHPENGIQVYLPGNLKTGGREITYSGLLQIAQRNAHKIRQLDGIEPKSIVLLYVTDHIDNIEWFWSIVQAGCVPCICTPLPRDLETRKKHLTHLTAMLRNPLLVTRANLIQETPELRMFERICTLEEFESKPMRCFETRQETHSSMERGDLAALMLTSGSSGNAKAVELRHGQILDAIEGKSICHNTGTSDIFLNWVGMDHVANLTEIHLHALYSAANQVHVPADVLLEDPLSFIHLIDRHRVTHSFAPNFFLASLLRAVQQVHPISSPRRPDLSCFRALTTGGEANVVKMCNALSTLLGSYGTLENVVRPMYGLTETCAGIIVSHLFPRYDLQNHHEFASVGICIPGMQMRVVTEDGAVANQTEIGDLEVRGRCVFSQYYNNPAATEDAFTPDGWFKTGDRAMIDSAGQLLLTGRAKETIIINGVKYIPTELETAITEARIPGVVPAFTAVFPHRPPHSQTEVICVVYLPSYDADDIEARVRVNEVINKISILQTGSRPYRIIPLDRACLERSSIGKLSRAKIRQAFERGDYKTLQDHNDNLIAAHKAKNYESPADATESSILQVVENLLDLDTSELGANDNIFDYGLSSVEVIRLLRRLKKQLFLSKPIPLEAMMNNPTIRGLAAAVRELEKPHEYDPVVVLQSKGSQQPLWLIHPGDGEILVYLQLARHFTERPVYAIRARGLNQQEEFFHSLDESVSTYHAAIKRVQPRGPYGIAGYSYGVINAFEIAKRLEADGDEIRFLGIVDLPPSLPQLAWFDWAAVLLNLTFFLDLTQEEHAMSLTQKMNRLSREEILDEILAIANPSRLISLGMDKQQLRRRADLTWNVLQTAVKPYRPAGMVSKMDVFYAAPLKLFGMTTQEWYRDYMMSWDHFVKGPICYHQVDGAHHTIFNPEHVSAMYRKLQHVLWERGF